MGSISGPGRIHMPRGYQARAPQLLSQCSRAQQLQLDKACTQQRARNNEHPAQPERRKEKQVTPVLKKRTRSASHHSNTPQISHIQEPMPGTKNL